MRIVIDKENVSIVFENDDEKKEFLDSEMFKQLTNWSSGKETKTVNDFDWEKWLEKHPLNRKFDWEKWKKEHPEIWNPIIYPAPNQIQDPPIDISPRIDDPVRFPNISDEPYRPSWITVTQHTDQRGGCDATPKFDGCDATPRYGKATVDWPGKYPCDATPAFLKDNGKKKRPRK